MTGETFLNRKFSTNFSIPFSEYFQLWLSEYLSLITNNQITINQWNVKKFNILRKNAQNSNWQKADKNTTYNTIHADIVIYDARNAWKLAVQHILWISFDSVIRQHNSSTVAVLRIGEFDSENRSERVREGKRFWMAMIALRMSSSQYQCKVQSFFSLGQAGYQRAL